uniref:Uncharacterized protein n=1 Tax=Eutreptiella gymnastica TaxID=73025 RepID=A0A7S4G120_9EUGL
MLSNMKLKHRLAEQHSTEVAGLAIVPLVAAIFGAAAITAAVYQRQQTMPKTSLKPTRQLVLFAAFQSPSAPKQKRVLEHTDIKQALLWFRGGPMLNRSGFQKTESISTTKPKQMLRTCTK